MASTKNRLSHILSSLLLAASTALIPQFASAQSAGAEGCGPGYWKTHTASWPPTGYSASQRVSSVFSAASAFPALASETLGDSLGGGGGPGALGGATVLLRAGVAAVLNASHPNVDYPHTVASVLSTVEAALASDDRDTMLMVAIELNEDNNGEGGCPLD